MAFDDCHSKVLHNVNWGSRYLKCVNDNTLTLPTAPAVETAVTPHTREYSLSLSLRLVVASYRYATLASVCQSNPFLKRPSPLIASVESNVWILISQEVRCHVKTELRSDVRRAIPLLWEWCLAHGLAVVSSKEE